MDSPAEIFTRKILNADDSVDNYRIITAAQADALREVEADLAHRPGESDHARMLRLMGWDEAAFAYFAAKAEDPRTFLMDVERGLAITASINRRAALGESLKQAFMGNSAVKYVGNLELRAVNADSMFLNATGLLSLGDVHSTGEYSSIISGCTNLERAGTANCLSVGVWGGLRYAPWRMCPKLRVFPLPFAVTQEWANRHWEGLGQGVNYLFQRDTALYWLNPGNHIDVTYWGGNGHSFSETSLRVLNLHGLGTAHALKSEPSGYFNERNFDLWGEGSEEARQSLVDSLLTRSFDRLAAGYAEPFTLQLHPDVVARLSQEEQAAIAAKGFTIAS